MRGRGLMLVAGMRMGQNQAKAQAQAQSQQQAAVEQAKQEGAAEAMAAAPAAPAAAPAKDVTAELQKLADLHKSGVLTDEEFSAAKKKTPWLIILKNLFLSGYHLSGVVHNIFYRDNPKSTDCIIYIYCPFVVTNLKE